MIVAGVRALVSEDSVDCSRVETLLADPATGRWQFEASRVRLVYGEMLRRRGSPVLARTHLLAARDGFAAMRAEPWLLRTQNELRASGYRQGGSSRDGIATVLTAQETEIARLAATGLTNKQIGARLYLSHRTVGAHLYRIYPKLGVTSRGALHEALTRYRDSDPAVADSHSAQSSADHRSGNEVT